MEAGTKTASFFVAVLFVDEFSNVLHDFVQPKSPIFHRPCVGF